MTIHNLSSTGSCCIRKGLNVSISTGSCCIRKGLNVSISNYQCLMAENEIEFSHLFQECFFRIGEDRRNDTEQNGKDTHGQQKSRKRERYNGK